MRRAWFFFISVVLAGCSGSSSGGSGSQSSEDPLVGSWSGYIEDYDYAEDAIRLRIDEVGDDGSVIGTFTYGSRSEPPPLDADEGYPPDLPAHEPVDRLPDGYAHAMLDARIEGERLRFAIRRYDGWNDWCGLQQPIYDGLNDRYACVPNGGTNQEGDRCEVFNPETTPIDCAKLALCLHVCLCTADGCSTDGETKIEFDLLVRDGKADGSGLGAAVHLTKQ